jgi:hypothetical protein
MWQVLTELALAAALLVAAPPKDELAPALGVGTDVAPGVRHYTLTDQTLLVPPAPISVHLLRLDLSMVDLTTDLALGDRQGRGTVLSAARRRQAIAAVNAGYFALHNGDPIGPLRVDGELVSDGTLGRGAAALVRDARGRPAWLFDRASVSVALVAERGGASIAVDGVDTTRALGALMVYTPRYGPNSDTAPTGIEWVLRHAPGAPGPSYVVAERRWHAGRTPIPRDGGTGGAPPPTWSAARGSCAAAAPTSATGSRSGWPPRSSGATRGRCSASIAPGSPGS